MSEDRNIFLRYIYVIVFLVFLLLKVTGVIHWPWIWVFLPLWIYCVIYSLIFLGIFVVLILKIIVGLITGEK